MLRIFPFSGHLIKGCGLHAGRRLDATDLDECIDKLITVFTQFINVVTIYKKKLF